MVRLFFSLDSLWKRSPWEDGDEGLGVVVFAKLSYPYTYSLRREGFKAVLSIVTAAPSFFYDPFRFGHPTWRTINSYPPVLVSDS